jgi:hypothetical protein
MLMQDGNRLASKSEIQDMMMRYARGVDRRDWPSVRDCFHDDATDNHGDFSGNIDEFIAWVSVMHAQVPFSCHFLGNCCIEFATDAKAVVETNFVATLQLGAASQKHRAMLMQGGASSDGASSGDTDMDVYGRYLDIFERRDDRWRIAKRMTVFDATRMYASQPGPLKPNWTLGKRDGTDPIYAWRKLGGLT